MKILIKAFFLLTFVFLFPTFTHAADLNITCFESQKPTVTTSTTPLFQLSDFFPGDTVTKSIEVINSDTVNPCTISIQGDGNSNILTDNIQFSITSIYSESLSDFINGDNIQIANLQPNQSVTRAITLFFPATANNSLVNKNASFDIKINSQWGNEQGNVLGDSTSFVNKEEQNNVQTENDKNPNQEEVLGTNKDINDTCHERTFWWVPLIIQILLTLLILPSKRLYLENIFIKFFITIALGILAFFIAKQIGCGCEIQVLCRYSWILNILFGLSPMPLMIKKFIKG